MANEPQAPLLSEEEIAGLELRDRYFIAECDACGYIASTEHFLWCPLPAGEDGDVRCPKCESDSYESGEDVCGKALARALATIKADRARIAELEAEKGAMLSEITLAHRNSTGTCHCKWCHAYWKAKALTGATNE